MEGAGRLIGETLVTLKEAAKDFGGVEVPMPTLLRWVKTGYKGLKLETVNINKLYTSKEAIKRFIEQKQNSGVVVIEPRVPRMSQAEVDTVLRRHGIIQ